MQSMVRFSVSHDVKQVGLIIMADALAGIGHACGHNLIAIVSLGAALATARLVSSRKLGGRVVLLGTPAEGLLA